jgi:hypothetical protein
MLSVVDAVVLGAVVLGAVVLGAVVRLSGKSCYEVARPGRSDSR